jgi:uncharacterized SAM-binding protein YcdF (DUF218 family)
MVKKRIIFFFKALIQISGVLLIVLLSLSFTSIPYLAYRKLAAVKIQLETSPTHIVILSGNGMPSPDALIKAYYATESALEFTSSQIIIAMPNDSKRSFKSLRLMAKELMVKGVDSSRILFEPTGFNTNTQIAAMSKMIPKSASILIITNPEHMYRSIKTFSKLGYNRVGSLPAFETPNEEVSLRNKSNEKSQIKNVDLRYNIWSYLQYEIKVIREYFAITYYWLMGWI